MGDRYPPSKWVDGIKLCRGCGKPIPLTKKGKQDRRRTWCSEECYDRYEPTRVAYRVRERANGKCEWCGWDFKTPDHYKQENRYIHEIHGYGMVGLPVYRGYELHHVIPVCEGGIWSDENIVLICDQCHKAETRKLLAKRNKRLESA